MTKASAAPETRFSYKPALLVGAKGYRVTGEAVIAETGEGAEDWRLAFADVARAAYVEHFIRGHCLRRLDLVDGGGTRRLIGFNGSQAPPPEDPDSAEHLRLLAATLRGIGAAQPDLSVTIGEHGRARWAIFAIGAASALGGIGIFAAALASGVSGGRLTEAAIPLGLMTLFGLALIYANAPWRALPRAPALVLAAALEQQADPPPAAGATED